MNGDNPDGEDHDALTRFVDYVAELPRDRQIGMLAEVLDRICLHCGSVLPKYGPCLECGTVRPNELETT